MVDLNQFLTKEEQSDGSRRFKFQLNHITSGSAAQWKESTTEKTMLEDVILTVSNSSVSDQIHVVLDTGADLTVVSPEWVQRNNVKLDAWNGPTLYMVNGSEAEVMGSVEIDVSNNRGKAAGTAIVMKLNVHDLLLGNNFMRQFGKLEIFYYNKDHQVLLGEELPVEMIAKKPDEDRLHVTKGRRIPKKIMARIAVATT